MAKKNKNPEVLTPRLPPDMPPSPKSLLNPPPIVGTVSNFLVTFYSFPLPASPTQLFHPQIYASANQSLFPSFSTAMVSPGLSSA